MKQNYLLVIKTSYCFINLGKLNFTQNSYKKHKKLMNSKLHNQPKSDTVSSRFKKARFKKE